MVQTLNFTRYCINARTGIYILLTDCVVISADVDSGEEYSSQSVSQIYEFYDFCLACWKVQVGLGFSRAL